MEKGDLARMIALVGTSVVLSLGLGLLVAPRCAAVAGAEAMRQPTPAAGNNCNLPTSVRPGSTYVTSWSNCYTCLYEEVSAHAVHRGRDYYCTYNPGSGLNDLFYAPLKPENDA
ncbi:hypothetical protein [Streptosporangium sp. NPDC002721]|uniref:hypothetical protein n=1 Tax=Streptosporangium sp. NPDC002721 TaxID=3366188 RepID=UPI0036988DDF